jgi:hypothetical protein
MNWGSHAQEHLQRIQTIIQAGTRALLRATCQDDAVAINLEAVLSSFNMEAYTKSTGQLIALVNDLQEKPLQTNNPLFASKIQSARRLRFENALARYLQHTGQLDGDNVIILRDPSSLFDALHISNSENLADEIHDTLKAYYDLAVVHFIESVNNHIVERYVGAPDGPVRAFSPLWVAGLQNWELGQLASENRETLVKRKEKESVLQRYQKAEKLLKDHPAVA